MIHHKFSNTIILFVVHFTSLVHKNSILFMWLFVLALVYYDLYMVGYVICLYVNMKKISDSKRLKAAAFNQLTTNFGQIAYK